VSDVDPNRHIYVRADLERVHPSQILEGDLLALAGPVGMRVYSGNRVTLAGLDGRDSTGGEKYRIEYDTPWGPMRIGQPESIPVLRIRRDARKDR
jgi:hypothetical protein